MSLTLVLVLILILILVLVLIETSGLLILILVLILIRRWVPTASLKFAEMPLEITKTCSLHYINNGVHIRDAIVVICFNLTFEKQFRLANPTSWT